jgi:hypothetical protein
MSALSGVSPEFSRPINTDFRKVKTLMDGIG